MASIPTYQRQYTDVPELRAPRAAIKGAFPLTYAREAEALSNAFLRASLKLKKSKDDAWVSKALATTSESYDLYTFGGGVEGAGVYNRKGETAVGSTIEANEVLQQSLDKIGEDAPSDAASRAFIERSRSLKVSTMRNITKHELAEVHDWNVSSSVANAAVQMKALSKGFYDGIAEVEEGFIAQVVPELERLAELKGIPVEPLIEANRAKLYDNIITQNIAVGGKEGVVLAAERLDKWGEDLTTERRAVLTASVRTRKNNLAGQEIVEGLIAADVPPTEALAKIAKIADPDIRAAAYSGYTTYRAADARIKRVEFLDMVDAAYVAVNGLAGDLVAQQLYVDNMKIDTTSQRKAKEQAQSLVNNFKAAKGMQPRTEPLAFDSAVEDIVFAEITDPRELNAEYGDKITEGDLKKLRKLLDDSQTFPAAELRTVFSWELGVDGEPKLVLTDDEKKNRGAFIMWAEKQAAKSNRATEKGYAEELADQWFLKGEVERGWTPGYGMNSTYGRAVRAKSQDRFLPGISGKIDKDIVSSSLHDLKLKPVVFEKLLQEYEGDEELAVRAYFHSQLMESIGPRIKKGSK